MEHLEDILDCSLARFTGPGISAWRSVSQTWARRWGRRAVWAALLRDITVPRARRLPELLRRAEGLQELGLSLQQSGLDDAGVRALAVRIVELPLEKLRLNLGNCPFRAGLADLAAALPPRLSVLELTLKGWGYQDSSVELIAPHLPFSLDRLHLDLGGSRITRAGAACLFQHLPQGLSELELLFFGCALGDGWLPELSSLPKLRKLLLNFSGTGLGDVGMSALGKLLGEELEELSLLVVSCGISDGGLAGLSFPRLRHLSLDLSGTDLTDSGLAGLRLPATLETLHLGVAGCEVSVLPQQLYSLPPLTELHYDWGSTKLEAAAASAIVRSLPSTLMKLQFCLRDVPLSSAAAGLPEHLPLGLRELRLDCTGCCLGPEGAVAVHRRVEQMPRLRQQELLCDAYGADVIVSVDEEDLEEHGLLGVRANHVHPALHDAVYLNNHSIFEGGPSSSKRRRLIQDDEDSCEEYL